MKKMERKGDITLNNALTLIIAILGIVVIIFFAWQLYTHFVSQEEKNAQELINTIEGKINILKDSKIPASSPFENGERIEQVFANFKGAEKWFFVAFDFDDDIYSRPDKCAFKNCICICYDSEGERIGGLSGTIQQRASKLCQKKGFCRFFDFSQINFWTGDNLKGTFPAVKAPATENAFFEWDIIKDKKIFNRLDIHHYYM